MADVAPETKTRTRLAAIGLGNGIGAGRAILGLRDLVAADEKDFFESLVADGPLLLIGPATWTGGEYQPPKAQFRVRCELYFGFVNDASYDFKAIEEILYALANALCKASNYAGQSVPPPVAWSLDGPQLFTGHKPIVGKYEIALTFPRAIT
jgi:hypothetical protein